MNIKITSDSTCDLPRELAAKYDVTLIPLVVIKGGQNFSDGIDITAEDIFAYGEATGDLCSTAAINVEDYRALFSRFSKQYDAIVHICIGSDFSSCYQNACIVAKEFPNVFVIDSQNVTTGHGHLVLQACEMAKTCTDVEAMCKELRDVIDRIETSFMLDRLDYMVKGGRCSSVVALGANLMRLKPCLSVIDGKVVAGKKYRGAYTKCITSYIRDRLEDRDDILEDTLFLTYTSVSPEIMAAAREAVAEYGWRFKQVLEAKAGCTISCHAGPGALGVMFVRKKNQ